MQLKQLMKLSSFVLALTVSHGVALGDESRAVGSRLELPSPSEIRDYEPINHMMSVEYANGRKFMFRVIKVSPRFECNQVKVDPVSRTIIIITQAVSNVYEYQLEPLPVMTSEWVAWNE